MGFNNAMMVLAANAQRAAATHMQSHSGAPGAANTSNVNTGARQPIAWSTPSGAGDYGLGAPITFTGIAPGSPVQHVSVWSGVSGGTSYGSFPVNGDAAANNAGEYTITALDLDGSAS